MFFESFLNFLKKILTKNKVSRSKDSKTVEVNSGCFEGLRRDGRLSFDAIRIHECIVIFFQLSDKLDQELTNQMA